MDSSQYLSSHQILRFWLQRRMMAVTACKAGDLGIVPHWKEFAWELEIMTGKSEDVISLLVVISGHKPPAMVWFRNLTKTGSSTSHMLYKSAELTPIAEVLITSFIWLNGEPRLCVMLADSELVGSRPGSETQTVRKLLSLLPWIIHVPTHLAAPDSRKGSVHGVQMFPAQRRQHRKFALHCKCQSNFFQLIPLTCLCDNKRKLNCDREPVWKIKLYICCVEGSSPGGSLQSDKCFHIFRAAANNYKMDFLLKDLHC